MSEDIVTEVKGGILTLTLDRQDRLNALTQPMYAALDAALNDAADDDAVRVVRIRGAGGHFTAGNDLNDFRTALRREDADLPVLRFLHTVVDFPKPLVAQVAGHAVGIGTTLLLHCDAVIAATDASFRLPFVPLGLVPEFGSSRALIELAGLQRASRWLLTGESFSAAVAEQLGLVGHICDAVALDAVTLAWCRRYAEQPPGALQAARALMRDAEFRERLHRSIDAEWRVFQQRLADPEHEQALERFFDARRR
jgi:enoyl-CoA hydratase/carnithine racemase